MEILTTPHSFLRHKAKRVTKVTDKLLKDIKEMIVVLKNTHDPKGVGLAATQVGLDHRMFILMPEKTPTVYINPEIIKVSHLLFSNVVKDENDQWMEGCLSIPKIWGTVDRPYQITLAYQTLDENNKLIDMTKEFEGIESAFVQHERDHLDGILFTDHVLSQKGQLYRESRGSFSPINL